MSISAVMGNFKWAEIIIMAYKWAIELLNLDLAGETLRLYAVAVPVFIAFLAILFIGAWIGWTMATTPPPKPIEEITTQMQEKKEEPKMEEPKPEESAAGTMPDRK